VSGAAARPTRPAPAQVAATRRAPALWALLTAALLAAFNLRTAVTSVGPLLDELQGDLALSSTVAGVLTTLPVISFALLGALVPRLAHAMGEQRLLAVGLVLMAGGLALRALVTSGVLFLLLSVVALVGGAMGNVLLPGLVKRHFAHRVGPMTAAYTTSMAIGAAVAAAATVPLAAIGGQVDWRVGLGAWAVPAAAAAVAWLLLPGDGKTAASDAERPVLRLRGSQHRVGRRLVLRSAGHAGLHLLRLVRAVLP
jgi:CP family cyanate transporter-like MFS transporter